MRATGFARNKDVEERIPKRRLGGVPKTKSQNIRMLRVVRWLFLQSILGHLSLNPSNHRIYNNSEIGLRFGSSLPPLPPEFADKFEVLAPRERPGTGTGSSSTLSSCSITTIPFAVTCVFR